MKAYQSNYRPLTEVEPGGGGIVSFMSFNRLAGQLNQESIDSKVVDYIVIEPTGINIYWKQDE